MLNIWEKYDILILEKKAPTPKWMLPRCLDVLMDTAYPVGRQDRHFYLRLFLLLRKASNAITRLPKAHNNVNMPMKIERISKAVICATVYASLRSSLIGCPPDIQRPSMYSGKPVIRCWEATSSLRYGRRQTSVHRTLSALSWVLSYGLRHATNISFFPPLFNNFRQFICPYFLLFFRCLLRISVINHFMKIGIK